MSLEVHPSEMKYVLITDIGSTTTKARFFERLEDGWRYIVSGEAPTTVEAPFEDVTLGVMNAVREVEELTGHQLLSGDGSGIVIPHKGVFGVDLYCTTSSAGGGLQMMVTGVIKTITAESANRAALGAGAIVMDVVAVDDGREDYQKIKQIRNLRPDMVLVAGGTDGGTLSHVISIAELINAADPKPRFGLTYKLPIVYAGNKNVSPHIKKIMDKNFVLIIEDNLRPMLEKENIEPARRAIHELFMEHVMSHAPGYDKLMKWTDVDIMPTPAAEGIAMQLIANSYKMNVIGVGLGGATTNVYSVVDNRFVRSVSANLGMSYSICNVLKEANIQNIMRWLPFDLDENDIECRLMNKMIRPTTIPQTLEELIIEHAVAREALRLGLIHHKTIATRLKGLKPERTVDDFFDQALEETYINMMDIDIIAGTGGLLSHAPKRMQSMMILTDGFQPEGITWMFQDSVFMMPHLGILSTVYKEAAWNIFDKDCLVRLGTVVAPKGIIKQMDKSFTIELQIHDDEIKEHHIKFGEIKYISLPLNQYAKAIITPNQRLDIGAGPGKKFVTKLIGGQAGIILDGRGRPLQLPQEERSRKEKLLEWLNNLKLYTNNTIKNL